MTDDSTEIIANLIKRIEALEGKPKQRDPDPIFGNDLLIELGKALDLPLATRVIIDVRLGYFTDVYIETSADERLFNIDWSSNLKEAKITRSDQTPLPDATPLTKPILTPEQGRYLDLFWMNGTGVENVVDVNLELAQLGCLEPISANRYRITPLGIEMAREWEQSRDA